MTTYLRDPAILICVGIILVGIIMLLIAIGKLFKKTAVDQTTDLGYSDSLTPAPNDSLFGADHFTSLDRTTMPPPEIKAEPAPRFTAPIASETATPPMNKEMAERLDEMSRRLSEMQTVLMRQVNNPVAAPLTAETIDQLLKIIGNVTLQVDILHRSLGTTLTTSSKPLETISPATVVSNPPPPAAKPTTPSTSTPAPSPSTAPPHSAPPSGAGSKVIGVAGGALSGFSRPGTKPGTGPVSTPPASNLPGK